MKRRLGDQALILEAVMSVRKELTDAAEAKAGSINTGEILMRLATLYALLDAKGLLWVVAQADSREQHNTTERKVA